MISRRLVDRIERDEKAGLDRGALMRMFPRWPKLVDRRVENQVGRGCLERSGARSFRYADEFLGGEIDVADLERAA